MLSTGEGGLPARVPVYFEFDAPAGAHELQPQRYHKPCRIPYLRAIGKAAAFG